MTCSPGAAGERRQSYPGGAVRGATPGKQQLDDVQVVVMDGHVQGGQAILQRTKTKETRCHFHGLSPRAPFRHGTPILHSKILFKILPRPVLTWSHDRMSGQDPEPCGNQRGRGQ